MPGIDRATGRVVALIALLILVGIALRGYLPPEEHPADDQPGDNPAAMIAVITLLAAAVAIITIAIVAKLREPRKPAQAGHPLSRSFAGRRARPSWRLLLLAVGLLLAWLLLVLVFTQFNVVIDLGQPSTTTATTPAPETTPVQPAPPAPPPDEEGGNLFWVLLATTIFMVAVWLAGFLITLRRHRRESQPQPFDAAEREHQPPAPHSLAVAAERGLAEIGDLSRDPREAIIACYAAMEDALSNAPEAMPQDSDTPSEVLARAVEHHAIHAGTATELVELFTEARFSPHVMTEEHREVAVRALQMVLADLKSAA